METADEGEHNVLDSFLNEEEQKQIPDGVIEKLKSYFTERLEEFLTAKAVFESGRQSLEQKLNELQKEHGERKLDLDDCRGKLELADKYNTDLQNKFDEARGEVFKLQESVKRLERENGWMRQQRDTASDDRDTLQQQVDRRDAEMERMRTELASLGSQLQTAVTAKCQALVDTEEVRSREMTLDFKEKRLEQERVLLSQQMAGLEEELVKRTNELQAARAESSARALLTETRLSQRDEELRIANESVAQLREANSTMQQRCDELAQKLEEQRAQELSMHASYREEVGAQTRLADLYKGVADEANAKADEFSSAVKELQELLEQATEQYGSLETQHNHMQLEHERELGEKQRAIEELTRELEHANDLLKSIKQERLDQAVEQLAPTAAVASKVLKKGLSLTQIYAQLVEATNELAMEKEENERLNSQLEVILRELEDKAPMLQRQREDYEAAVANVSELTTRLDDLLAENHRLREDAGEASRVANHHARENQRLKTELADLARQVCFLLKEVQESRGGGTMSSDSYSSAMETNDLASSQIISKKLVTFRDIEELQENNQKLLSIVRTLSSRQEEIERATDEINSGEMKEKLDRYVEQLAEMQAAQDRQSKMLDGLLRQRDMYKNMYQQCLQQTAASTGQESAPEETNGVGRKVEKEESQTMGEKEKGEKEEGERKLAEAESKLRQMREEFETYRKEKMAHERMLGEDVERLRKEAEASSNRCCRLKAQMDSANERFHLLQANVASYKSQIKTLEEKCNNYSTTIGKHEQSIMILKDEILDAQARQSRAEVQLEKLRQEHKLLRDSEGRLLMEREVLHRERQTQAVLRADVEAIKTSLERAQAEGQLRAEQRLDDATRECAALRRRLQEEQDRFRELASHLERQLAAAQQRLTEERELAERAQEELEQARTRITEDSQRLEELSAKLRQAESHSISKPISGDESMTKRSKELETQLASAQAEVKSLVEQLRAARQHGEQYCDIAESSEAQLRELTSEYERCKKEHENTLKVAQGEVASLNKKVKDLEEELTRMRSGRQETDSELRERLAITMQQLEELDEAKGELELVKSDLQNASTAAREAEEKYAREMVLHSADLQVLAKLKEEAGAGAGKIASLARERDAAVEALNLEKASWQEREQRLNDEIRETQKRVVDLDAQNSLLHDQIQELSDRAAVMQSHQSKMGERESPDTSMEAMNHSFTGLEEDSKSAEQLLRVMKFLRREKDLVVAKFDVLRAENLRLKSQTEVAEKRAKESEALLNAEREKSEIDVVTASKHSELLRKVETLNAIADSNRILREERDKLSAKVSELTIQVTALSEEVVPLREQARDWAAKNDALLLENAGLKEEATRWRQRANALVERANKASPEDWRRLQTERENLSKLLTSEREIHAKRSEELLAVKAEKARMEEQLVNLQRQLQAQGENNAKISEEAKRLGQELNEAATDASNKARDVSTLRKEIADKEAALADIRNKEIMIRQIAKKYKTRYEDLAKSTEEEKSRLEEARSSGIATGVAEAAQLTQEREDQLREEGRQELRQANHDLMAKIEELAHQMSTVQNEAAALKVEIETVNKASLEKEERAKQVLKGARTKIMQLSESKKVCEKELNDLKARVESNTSDSDMTEHDARLAAIKSQMEGRISRLEHEKAEVLAEKEALAQRVAQLQRQLAAGVGGPTVTTEPPTANIKPMSARAETPLASIRPMSVVVQSRTAAVLPTTAAAPVLVAPQQQAVHTTETGSPTSSHTDYQPASTSSSSQTTSSSMRQLAVQPQLSESAESTQREDSESGETLQVQQQQQQQQQCQQQQQTVALVSPRVEQQQQQQLQQQPTASASDQQQTVASSSTQSVTTSQISAGHKRPRSLDTSTSGVAEIDPIRQEQSPTPKTKRSRQQEVPPTPTASASEVEYQVPTSSQRDQDEEVEEGCVVVVDCDEGGDGTHQTQEEEEFENDPYEEMEEEEELPYGEVEVEVEGDNNEVEIIMEEDSTNVEVSRQVQPTITANQQQQQSEAISSAGPTGEPPSSFAPRSSRGIAPMPRQQQQQHLLLPQQGYEDAGDDSIVPSTPTLFVPRRGDGFGEAVSSPQVPQGRFTFGDPAPTATAAPTQTLATPAGPTRAMFGSASSGVAQVAEDGMDDTRMDLTQLEDAGTGRSVPTTPLQVSPAADLPPSTSSGLSEEQEAACSAGGTSTVSASGDGKADIIVPSIRITSGDEQGLTQPEPITENDDLTSADGVSSEGEKQGDVAGTSASGPEGDEAIEAELVEEAGGETAEDDVEEEGREAEASPSSNTRQRALAAAAAAAAMSPASNRGGTARRSARSPFRATRGQRPTPIVWENQPGRGQNVQRGMATRGAGGDGRMRGARGRRMRKQFPYARF